MKTKIISIAIIAMILIASIITISSASGLPSFVENPQNMTASNLDPNTENKVTSIAGQIIGVVQTIGVAVAVIMLVVYAIKYISAAPSEKADIKKGAIGYVVGALILFAATGVLQIIKTFTTETVLK